MLWAIFAGTAVFIAIVAVIAAKKNKQLTESGKIIKRPMNFWENEELFLAAASYETVRETVLAQDLSACAVTITPDVEGRAVILFRCRHGWNAALCWLGERDGRGAFRFYFPAWKTGRYGAPYGFNQMNMLLTAIERLFLALDPDTALETRRLQTKTRSRLF